MTETATPTLTEFLRARYDEEEAAILNGWDSDGRARVAAMWTGGEPGYTTVASDHADGEWIADGRSVDDARHVQVLLDPARVLADIKAKRRIVERHEGWHVCPSGNGLGYTDYGDGSGEEWESICPTLRDLASVYADHSDYDPEWRP